MERGCAGGINKLIFLKCDDSEFFCCCYEVLISKQLGKRKLRFVQAA
nr:MAG TPA: hypothetical protein [Caudoviricetes sp.]